MKLLIKQNTTGVLTTIFVQNNSVATGAGLSGLAYNTAGLTAYYFRQGDSASTAIALVTMTAGTWASGGLVKIDDTNMPGIIQVGLPNACFANLGSVVVYLQGAANMAPVVLEFQIVAFDPTVGTNLGLSGLPTANPGASGGVQTVGTAVTLPANPPNNFLVSGSFASTCNFTNAMLNSMGNIFAEEIDGSFSFDPDGYVLTDMFSYGGTLIANGITVTMSNSLLNVNSENIGGQLPTIDANHNLEVSLAANQPAALTESYAANGSTATIAQLLYMIWSYLANKGLVGTTLTTTKLDGATESMAFTVNSSTEPTTQTRTT